MARAGTLAVPGRAAGGGREGIRFDVIAGLITAAVVIPKAMAYASIAGLPVQVGLTTALVPMVIYALLGTSRVLCVSTTTTIAILTAAQLSAVAPDGDPAALVKTAAALALLVGGVLVVASLLRLGFVADFISEPVLVGFKAGIGLVIVFDQLPKLLGVHFPKTGFFRNLAATLPEHSRDLRGRRSSSESGRSRCSSDSSDFLPKVPAPLVVVAAGIAAMALLGLDARGVEAIGKISAGLPSPVLPDLSLAGRLWPGALGIALMSFTETIAAGRAFARTDEPLLKPNRELLATGLANAGGAFFGAMPAGGGTSQTAVNRRAGARTQVAELVTAAVTLADDALPRALDRPHAPGDPGGRRDRLLDRPDPAGRVPRDPRRPADGVGLGPDRVRRRRPARDASRDPRRHRGFARRPLPPDGQSAGPGPRAQARHQRLPSSHQGAPGGRDVSRACCCCGSKGGFSSPTRGGSPRRCGRSSPRRIRRSSRST